MPPPDGPALLPADRAALAVEAYRLADTFKVPMPAVVRRLGLADLTSFGDLLTHGTRRRDEEDYAKWLTHACVAADAEAAPRIG